MTKQQFLEKLNEIKDIFEWQIDNNYYIRGYQNGFDFCPITAVCWQEVGYYASPSNYEDARLKLELSEADAEEIIYAADAHSTWTEEVSYDKELRNEIRIILGFGPSEGIYI